MTTVTGQSDFSRCGYPGRVAALRQPSKRRHKQEVFVHFWKTLAAAFTLAMFSHPGSAAIDGVMETGNIRYVSGGVGEQERRELESAAGAFDVKVQLASDSGAFLANTTVRVFDQSGQEVLAMRTRGPLLLLDLPAGSYRIEAEHRGHKQGARVKVDEGEAIKPLTLSWAQ